MSLFRGTDSVHNAGYTGPRLAENLVNRGHWTHRPLDA